MSVQKINLFEQVSQFYIGSQASIEATTGVQEGSLGYATDINKMGSYNGATWDWAGSGSGGHTIQDEGTPLTARTNLNFVGAGVTATDDAGNNATVVTIPGGGGSAHIIEDEGTPLTARANLNFIGGGVTATDNAGANATDITIPAAPTQEEIEDYVGGMVTGNTETGIDVTYDDASGKLNFDAQTAGDTRYEKRATAVTTINLTGANATYAATPGAFNIVEVGLSGITGSSRAILVSCTGSNVIGTIVVFVVTSDAGSYVGSINPDTGFTLHGTPTSPWDKSLRYNKQVVIIKFTSATNFEVISSAGFQEGNLALTARATATFTTSPQDNYSLGVTDVLTVNASTVDVDFTGFSNVLLPGNSLITLRNAGSKNIVLKHASGSSTVSFVLPGGNDYTVYPGDSVTLQLYYTGGYFYIVGSSVVSAGSGGHTIQEEGTPLTTRAALNFKGTGVTAADNAGANSTDVTVVINETTLTTTDITTGDVSTSKHGLVPKLPNTQYKALRGDGSWGGIADRDGWIQFLEASYAYASASTFTITGDYSSTFRKGLRLLWHDSVGWKWGVVLSSAYGAPNTTVTIFTNTDYVLATGMDFIFWSDAAQPNGFPAYFNYTPATTSITIGNGAITGRYYVLGSQVFGDYTLTRGSTTSFTGNIAIGYPCAVNQNAYFVSGNVSLVDTATALYTGICLADGTVRCMTTSGAYAVYAYVTSTAPFTWGSGDVIEGSFRYRY